MKIITMAANYIQSSLFSDAIMAVKGQIEGTAQIIYINCSVIAP